MPGAGPPEKGFTGRSYAKTIACRRQGGQTGRAKAKPFNAEKRSKQRKDEESQKLTTETRKL